MSIPAKKKLISVPHKSGATVRVRPITKANMIRLHAFTRFDPDDPPTTGVYIFNGLRMCVASVEGEKKLEQCSPKYHRGLDSEVMPDEVAVFVMEDPECLARAVEAMHSEMMDPNDPNSSRQPTGSSDAPSGLPPTESTPKT